MGDSPLWAEQSWVIQLREPLFAYQGWDQAHGLHQALCFPGLDQLEPHVVWAAQLPSKCWLSQVLFHLCPALGKVVGLLLPSMVLEFPRFFLSQSFL